MPDNWNIDKKWGGKGFSYRPSFYLPLKTTELNGMLPPLDANQSSYTSATEQVMIDNEGNFKVVDPNVFFADGARWISSTEISDVDSEGDPITDIKGFSPQVQATNIYNGDDVASKKIDPSTLPSQHTNGSLVAFKNNTGIDGEQITASPLTKYTIQKWLYADDISNKNVRIFSYNGSTFTELYISSWSALGMLNNTWKCFEQTITTLADTIRIYAYANQDASNITSYYWSNPQVELGDVATRYIPTYGTSVTRQATDLNYPASTINQSAGTIFADVEIRDKTGETELISTVLESETGQLLVQWNESTDQWTVKLGTTAYTYSDTLTYSERQKIGIKYDNATDIMKFYKNGTLIGSETSFDFDTWTDTYVQIGMSTALDETVVHIRDLSGTDTALQDFAMARRTS